MAETTEPPATDQGQPGLGSVDAELLRRFMAAFRRGDIALALGIIGILVVLILPMPAWLLDFCLALSITLSVLILLVVLFIHRPIDFSAFPTVLLIATMLLLALKLFFSHAGGPRIFFFYMIMHAAGLADRWRLRRAGFRYTDRPHQSQVELG